MLSWLCYCYQGMTATKFAIPILVACLGELAQGQISRFQHVVVIVQENRTPDNLFQGLCASRTANAKPCSTTPSSTQYNIQATNWLDKTSPGGVIQPSPIPLANQYDLSHTHAAFVSMCDVNSAGACRNDGADAIPCIATCPSKPQFRFVDNSSHAVDPYLALARQYGWANYMFQTNQGPSFPAHQFLFGGTSAPTATADAAGTFAAENLDGKAVVAGCIAPTGTTIDVIAANIGETLKMYPCFEHETMADLLPASVTWRYYAPSAGSIWTAPDAIAHICQSTGPGGKCAGPAWTQNVDLVPADVLTDISACRLASLSWVVPTGVNSDHAGINDAGGPSWVASIVNAIGNSASCDGNNGYWKNTAILIVWDDWRGWYDHEPPTILPGVQGDYQYGFRVPLIVVSAYTPPGYINNVRHDFGSILRFIESNFSLPLGALNFADARAISDLTAFFNVAQPARAFRNIRAPRNASFFILDRRRPTDPDDDQ